MEPQIKINNVTYSHIIDCLLHRRRNVAIHNYLRSMGEIFEDISSISFLEVIYELRVTKAELDTLRQAKQQRIVTLKDSNIFDGSVDAWFYELEETYEPKKERPWLVKIKLYVYNYVPPRQLSSTLSFNQIGYNVWIGISKTPARNCWYANGYYYFISDAGELYSSPDGVNWTLKQDNVLEGKPNAIMTNTAIYFDGTYVHLVTQDYTGSPPNVYYKRGTCANGNVNWDSWQNVPQGSTIYEYGETCNIVTTADGIIWIIYVTFSSSENRRLWAVKSLNTTGTSWGSPVLIKTGVYQYNNFTLHNGITRLSSNSVYITYIAGSPKTLIGRTWDGTTLGDEETIFETDEKWVVLSDAENNIHVIGQSPHGTIKHRKRVNGIWQSENIVVTGENWIMEVTASLRTSNQHIYLVYNASEPYEFPVIIKGAEYDGETWSSPEIIYQGSDWYYAGNAPSLPETFTNKFWLLLDADDLNWYSMLLFGYR